MHGLLAIVNRVTILCYPLVCVHCGPVEDFLIAKQTSLHPFDFVRNLFHLRLAIEIEHGVCPQKLILNKCLAASTYILRVTLQQGTAFLIMFTVCKIKWRDNL